MPYIQRDKAGEITSISESPEKSDHEYMSLDNPELIDYLTRSSTRDDAKVALAVSDIDLIRVLEDLVNTLIDKKVIMFTDLPLAAREKLVGREKVRGHLTDLNNLVADEEGLL